MTQKFKQKLLWHLFISIMVYIGMAYITQEPNILAFDEKARENFLGFMIMANVTCAVILFFSGCKFD